MASFTETATLKVVDKSSAEIKAINAALKALAKTVAGLKGSKTLGINAPAIKAGAKSINQTIKAVNELRRNEKRTAAEQARNIQANIRRQKQLSATQQEVVRAGYQRESARRIRREAARDAYDAAYDPNKRRRRPPLPPPPPPPTGGGSRGAAGAPRQAPGQALVHSSHAVVGSFARVVSAASRLAAAFGLVGGVAAVAREGVQAVVASEDARMRLKQSGFTEKQVDLFMAQARKSQEEFGRVPAAAIANAAVEQLNAIKANNGTFADYQQAMNRIAANAQIMAMTFKDPAKGAESARQLERASQIMGKDVDNTEIRKVQDAIMRATIASGGEMSVAESVRALQQMGSSIVKAMSAQALTDLLMVRDEGGRQSTAEWRMAIQELQRGSLNEDDKAAMARHGLRKKSGAADPAIVNEAASDLVGFAERRIVPILEKAGLAQASSAAIATHLDEVVGYTTSGARALADIVTSLRDGELQRQRAAARAVNLDPRLGDKSFRGGAEKLRASFDTALARPLDKMGPAFTEAIAPFTASMDRAGKIAEKGDYAGAAAEMAKAGADLLAGPAGTVASTMALVNALKTTLDPTATPLEKGAALLVTGATTLTSAAAAMLKHFKGDPVQEAKDQKELAERTQAEIKTLDQQIAEERAKSPRGSARLRSLERTREAAENQLRDVQRQLAASEDKVRALNEEAARQKAEDEATMKRLERESGLGPKSRTEAEIEARRKDLEPDLEKSDKRLEQKAKAYEKAFAAAQARPGRETAAALKARQAELDKERATNTQLKNQLQQLQEERDRLTKPPEPEPPKPRAEVEPPKEETPIKQATEDLSTATNNFQTVMNTLPQKGTEAGSNFNSGVDAQSIGSAIGSAFAAVASGIKIGVDVSGVQNAVNKSSNTGTLNSVPA